jgi:hypothetical protein
MSARQIAAENPGGLALAGFETRIFLIDNVDTAFAANHAAVLVAALKRF